MKIRNAKAEDAPFLARNILVAGRAHVKKGIWEVILGGSEDKCLNFLHHLSITSIPHPFHYSYYLVAVNKEERTIGGLGGYDPNIAGYQNLDQAIPEVLKKLKLPSQPLSNSEERSTRILACIPQNIEGAWVIDSVATMPEHRGKGVAEYLLSNIVEMGKKQGYRQAQLSMYIGNTPALKLYQKIGFEIIEEKRDKFFEKEIGSPGMISLAKRL